MDADPTLIIGAFVAGVIALDKAGLWNRRRLDKKNGSAPLTKSELETQLEPVHEKLDKHGERLAVLESHVGPNNGRGGL